jgi:hypothetical protein
MKPTPAQLALLCEMAAAHDRHIIHNRYGLRRSWQPEPGKRQIESRTVAVLVRRRSLTHRDGTPPTWWLTDAGRALAQGAQEREP